MNSNGEITIEFSEEQQTEIIQKCGFAPKPIVTNSLSLVMLSLAATAKKSEALPFVNRLSTANQILESPENNLSNQPYTVTLELSDEQREKIRNVVNKDWHQIIIVPDDYDINFKQIWENEEPIQQVGKSFVIVSEEAEYSASKNKKIIKLPFVNDKNNNTFGTGSHPTTQTVVCLLEKYMRPEIKVLDIGTGSGILAVAAAKLGAGEVFAIDIDSTAVETARKTANLNKVSDKITIEIGSVEIIEDTYDLVIANLFPKIIISIAKSLSEKVAANGVVILSGLVSARIPQIIQTMQEVGFEHLESLTIDFWGGIAFRKRN